MTHRCPVPGCEQPAPPGLALCRRHWRLVPGPERRALWQEYRVELEAGALPTALYAAALRRAVAAVARREAGP